MSIIDGINHFNMLSENDFWSELWQANKAHITSRQRYGKLLDLCRSRCVKFEDIENHLLNEAKKCGLYRKDHLPKHAPKGSSYQYAPFSRLTQRKDAWFIALKNFMTWVKANYVNYGVQKARVKAVESTKQAVVVNRTTAKRTTTKGATKKELLKAAKDGTLVDETSKDSIIAPIQSDLSLAETQAIILRNPDVLGSLLEQHGGQEGIKLFNEVCKMIGGPWLDSQIEIDDPEILQDAMELGDGSKDLSMMA